MKKPVSPHTVACLILGLIAPLSAQNPAGNHHPSEFTLKSGDGDCRFAAVSAMPGTYEVPALECAEGEIPPESAVFAAQDSFTLDLKGDGPRTVEAVVDLGILRNPSPYRKLMASTKGQPYRISEDGLRNGLARISAAYRESGKPGESSDCPVIALSVEQQVRLDSSRVLEIVELEINANPDCACEVVKTAITASEAGVDEVVAIVEVAIQASPESMRIVSQCAIAAMPESIADVQGLLSRLDPNGGESSYSSKGAKSAKGAKVASIIAPPRPNSLDRPYLPPLPPPPLFPPSVTDVNPSAPTF